MAIRGDGVQTCRHRYSLPGRHGGDLPAQYAAERYEADDRQGAAFVVTFFALAAALLYGSADFLGGVATRRAQALSVLPASALAGLLIVVVAAVASGERPSTTGLGWGLAAGAVGGIGLIVFYAGLAEGPMSIVAPTSALTATVLPVGVALAEGERANPLVYVGAAICPGCNRDGQFGWHSRHRAGLGQLDWPPGWSRLPRPGHRLWRDGGNDIRPVFRLPP